MISLENGGTQPDNVNVIGRQAAGWGIIRFPIHWRLRFLSPLKYLWEYWLTSKSGSHVTGLLPFPL